MTAPFLKQWYNREATVAQCAAKQHEFEIYIPPLTAMLRSLGVRDIVDFQADEGVASIAACLEIPGLHSTFITVPPELDDPERTGAKMAESITRDLRDEGRIRLVANAAEIPDASADAIMFNNILGCHGSLQNIDAIIGTAQRVVRPGGYAVVTAPNPEGEVFSSYTCTNVPNDHGGMYLFQMRKGDDDAGAHPEFENVYLTGPGLTDQFARAGFVETSSQSVADKPWQGFKAEKPAFFQWAFRKSFGFA